jgi:hypothetical protein
MGASGTREQGNEERRDGTLLKTGGPYNSTILDKNKTPGYGATTAPLNHSSMAAHSSCTTTVSYQLLR